MTILFYATIICLNSEHLRAQTSFNSSIIEFEQFQEVVKDQSLQLIDVRTPKEYKEGYIALAKNISIKNRKKFKAAVQKLEKEKPIYVYCYSGVRSKRASKILKRLGFKKIVDFKGGWKEWKEHQN